MIYEIDPQGAYEKIKFKQAIFIDVREKHEFEICNIQPCELMPMSIFDPQKINNFGNKEIIFYCRSGVRSFFAAQKYFEHSPNTKVYNLTGGINAWKVCDLSLVVV
jgi:rhodanese-related sulfurtransferase